MQSTLFAWIEKKSLNILSFRRRVGIAAHLQKFLLGLSSAAKFSPCSQLK
jgi:hypothetical protein